MTHGERHRAYWEQPTTGGGFRALRELRAGAALSSAWARQDKRGLAQTDV